MQSPTAGFRIKHHPHGGELLGTNLGLTRMAEACSVASCRQLVWTAVWHLREETYRRALAILVNAQQRQPLAAFFGAADVSSSDGQHFPTAGPGEAVGAVNAHYERTASTDLRYVEYMQHFHLIDLCFLVARIIGYSLLAWWLFKGGEEVSELLLPSTVEPQMIQQGP